MSNMVKIAALFVALAATASFSQGGGTKYGIRAGFNLYDFSSGDKEMDKYMNMGTGFGGGLAQKTPLASAVSLNAELNFFYRKIISMDIEGVEIYSTEMAFSSPIMLQFMPIDGAPYLAVGVQLDYPMSPKETMKYQGESVTEKYITRASVDFGIALGLGYNITEYISADIRCVIGLTNPDDDEGMEDSSFNQYGLGLTYFF